MPGLVTASFCVRSNQLFSTEPVTEHYLRHGLSPTSVHVVYVVNRVVWDSFPPSTLIVPCRYHTTKSLTHHQCTLILATDTVK